MLRFSNPGPCRWETWWRYPNARRTVPLFPACSFLQRRHGNPRRLQHLDRRVEILAGRLRAIAMVPTQSICRVPEEDRLKLADWTGHGIEAPSDAVIAEDYVRKARRHAQGLIETKRVQPQSDIFFDDRSGTFRH